MSIDKSSSNWGKSWVELDNREHNKRCIVSQTGEEPVIWPVAKKPQPDLSKLKVEGSGYISRDIGRYRRIDTIDELVDSVLALNLHKKEQDGELTQTHTNRADISWDYLKHMIKNYRCGMYYRIVSPVGQPTEKGES